MTQVNIGLCQMPVRERKEENLTRALQSIREAVAQGADIVVLPEMFICPYSISDFPRYAEKRDGPVVANLAKIARELGCYLVGGSLPEQDQEQIYNTSFVFDREGNIIARHRKLHLFDVDLPGVICRESDIFTPGDSITTFETEFGRFGLAICYDLRFPELFRLLVAREVHSVIVPAVFNPVTGPVHWELLLRSRAVDNQIFMIGSSPAHNAEASYKPYGHSMVVDPFGTILLEMGPGEDTGVVTMNLTVLAEVRHRLPLLEHRRKDLY